MTSASASTHEIPSLDGWRAIAIALVFAGHAGLGNIVPGGLGVTIFFFLSGYLITTLLIKEYRQTNAINITNFYARRALRLMPPLLITLVACYLLTSIGAIAGNVTLAGFFSQLFYFANYYFLFFDGGNTTPIGTGVFWSLSVEEHFYIVFPALIVLMFRNINYWKIPAVLFAISVGILLWRFHLAGSSEFASNRIYYATDTRIDSIIYGCILATYVTREQPQLKPEPSLPVLITIALALALIAFTLVFRNEMFRDTIRYSVQGLALLPLFLYSIKHHNNGLFKILNMPMVKKIGVYSYSIYLSHQIIIENTKFISPSVLANSMIALAISLIFAYTIDRYVDNRTRHLRARFR